MEDEVSNEQSSDYSFDLKRWKSKIQHLKTELSFIDRQLIQVEFVSASILIALKNKALNKREALNKLISEIEFFEHDLYKNTASVSAHLKSISENHEVINNKIEKLFYEMKSFKYRVLQKTQN